MNDEEKEQVRQELAAAAQATIPEWLRSMGVDIEGHPLEANFLRLEWQSETDVHIKESRYAEPLLRARVRVDVELLPDLPPIGPENDSALAYEPPWHDPECRDVCCRDEQPDWVPATFLMCLAGDRIRIGGQESEVRRSSSGVWHANNANAWHPTPWVHTELRMDLAANPGFQEYPPNTPCEILMSPERLGTHVLMLQFPGTQPVDK